MSTRLRRLSGVLPLITIYAWLCLLYGWESWGERTPWNFTDEVERAQLSRAIAATGHAARRGVAASPESFYSYLIAPAWWIHDTGTSYGVIKAIGVAVMTASIFPAYALARMFTSRRPALLAATAVAAIPALVYSSLLALEPLAYTWAVLCFWLIVKALTTRGRWWIAASIAASVLAPGMRSELAVIPASYVAAVGLFWFTGEGGHRWRRGWSLRDWAGFVVLIAGVLIFANAYASHRSTELVTSTQLYRDRMLPYSLWAAGAVMIGIGVLPLVAGLAALFPGRWSNRTNAERAFMALSIPSLLSFGYYTAVKAVFLSTVLTVGVAERNLMYVAPILLIATALFFERRQAHPIALAGAAAFAVYLIQTTPYHMEVHFYGDAPGLSILQSANRVLAFTPHDAKVALYAVLVLSCAVAIAAVVARGRAVRNAIAVAGVFVLAWCLTGQITGARASHEAGSQLLENFPSPYDWIDRATHGAPTVFIGQRLSNGPEGIWLLEFWNRSIQGVYSTDGTTIGPGPSGYAGLVSTNGALDVDPKFKYAVTNEGVNLVGRVVALKQHYVGGAAVAVDALPRDAADAAAEQRRGRLRRRLVRQDALLLEGAGDERVHAVRDARQQARLPGRHGVARRRRSHFAGKRPRACRDGQARRDELRLQLAADRQGADREAAAREARPQQAVRDPRPARAVPRRRQGLAAVQPARPQSRERRPARARRAGVVQIRATRPGTCAGQESGRDGPLRRRLDLDGRDVHAVVDAVRAARHDERDDLAAQLGRPGRSRPRARHDRNGRQSPRQRPPGLRGDERHLDSERGPCTRRGSGRSRSRRRRRRSW